MVHVNAVSSSPPMLVPVSINETVVNMEVDTGATVTLVSEVAFKKFFNHLVLAPSTYVLTSVTGPIAVLGQCSVSVSLGGQSPVILYFIVCQTNLVNCLMGRQWLDVLFPAWRSMFSVPETVSIQSVKDTVDKYMSLYPSVFDVSDNTPIKTFKASLKLRPNFNNVISAPYDLPYALVPVVESMLDKMVKAGKVVPIMHSNNSSPCLPVKKKDGSYRLCIDFKRTLNKQLSVDQYPLPRIDNIFASLAGAVIFTVIDLSDAYMQLELDEESKQLVVITTHKGLFQFNRLVYGIASAPAIFQYVVNCILAGTEGVKSYLDDILVWGKSFLECEQRTNAVLQKLNEYNVKVKLPKCTWFSPTVEYLGHVLSKEGRKPAPSKVHAIVHCKTPADATDVRSFLGLLNYYMPFLPDICTVNHPLRALTKANVKFEWSEPCVKAFETCKQMIVDSEVLTHFDPKLPLVLACDASPVGVAAILSHKVMVDGKEVEKVIMFASCALSERQQKYSQIDRESLAIIFAVTKTHKFIWAREFLLVTDNAALRHILSPDKGVPLVANQRLQHWAFILEAYQYKLVHRKAEFMSHVDALSRLPAPDSFDEVVFNVDAMPVTPVNVNIIADCTAKDPILSRVRFYVIQGWPQHRLIDVNLQRFYELRFQLSVDQGCVMYGPAVVIPSKLQAEVLSILHEGHPGVVRLRMNAKNLVWWPSINSDIDAKCQQCSPCAIVNFKPVKQYLPWPRPKFPFERIHVDFFQYERLVFLIVCDSFSKWIDVVQMSNTRAPSVISVLESIFCIFGDPVKIVADNGPPFDSLDLKDYCTSKDIILSHSPVYHPESNGLAERAVQTVKRALHKIMLASNLPVAQALVRFLTTYRNTPTTATGKAPNDLLLVYRPRTALSKLNPKCNPGSGTSHVYKEGDKVLVRFSKKHPVISGVVIRPLGSSMYQVSINGVIKPLHINQLQPAA